jgi:hypothetical protein
VGISPPPRTFEKKLERVVGVALAVAAVALVAFAVQPAFRHAAGELPCRDLGLRHDRWCGGHSVSTPKGEAKAWLADGKPHADRCQRFLDAMSDERRVASSGGSFPCMRGDDLSQADPTRFTPTSCSPIGIDDDETRCFSCAMPTRARVYVAYAGDCQRARYLWREGTDATRAVSSLLARRASD